MSEEVSKAEFSPTLMSVIMIAALSQLMTCNTSCLDGIFMGLCLKYINIKTVCTVPLLGSEASLIIEH